MLKGMDVSGMRWVAFDTAAERDEAMRMIEAMRWAHQKRSDVTESNGAWRATWLDDEGAAISATGGHDTPWDAILAAKEESEAE